MPGLSGVYLEKMMFPLCEEPKKDGDKTVILPSLLEGVSLQTLHSQH